MVVVTAAVDVVTFEVVVHLDADVIVSLCSVYHVFDWLCVF